MRKNKESRQELPCLQPLSLSPRRGRSRLNAREAPATALPRREDLPNRFLCLLGEELLYSKQTHEKSRPELYPITAYLSLTAFFVSSATKNLTTFLCATNLQSKPCHVVHTMLQGLPCCTLSRRSWWPHSS